MERFETEKGILFHGDCFEILPEIDDTVDLVLTDPPWNISREAVIHRVMNPKKYKYTGKDISLDFGEWDHFESEEAYLEFTRRWMEEAVRLLKPSGHLVSFFDQNLTTELIRIGRNLGLKMRQHLYWLKTNPVPRAKKVDFMVALEHACWFTKPPRKGATFNYQLGQQRNYVEAGIPTGKWRIHPTQKPLKVLKVWIEYLSNPGDLVLDPFAGSGATAVACEVLGRRWIAIEKEREYFEKAVEWLESTTLQLGLF